MVSGVFQEENMSLRVNLKRLFPVKVETCHISVLTMAI